MLKTSFLRMSFVTLKPPFIGGFKLYVGRIRNKQYVIRSKALAHLILLHPTQIPGYQTSEVSEKPPEMEMCL